VEIGTSSIGQRRFGAAAIIGLGYGAQRATCHPSATAFVAGNRSPASGTYSLSTPVNTAADRTGTGNHYHTRLPISRSVKRNLSIANNLHVANANTIECLAHACSQFSTARACQANFGCHDVISPHLSIGTCSVNRFANCGRGTGNSDSQRVGWTSCTFPENTMLGIHDHRKRLGAAAIDTNHGMLSTQTARGQYICCPAISRELVPARSGI
jgi:hypothetical protein